MSKSNRNPISDMTPSLATCIGVSSNNTVMNIKSETRWVIISTITNRVWLEYSRLSKKEVVKDFMGSENELYSWSEFSKKYNWDCIKVKISFEQINKK